MCEFAPVFGNLVLTITATEALLSTNYTISLLIIINSLFTSILILSLGSFISIGAPSSSDSLIHSTTFIAPSSFLLSGSNLNNNKLKLIEPLKVMLEILGSLVKKIRAIIHFLESFNVAKQI